MPDVINLLKEVLKFKIEVQVKAYDFNVDLTLNIRNLDQFIFKNSVLMDEEEESPLSCEDNS